MPSGPGLHVLVTADHHGNPCASAPPVACMTQVVWAEQQGGMNRVIWQPAGTHGRYSPVPTLATLLVLKEHLFGLMGSLAFEQRARPLSFAHGSSDRDLKGKGSPCWHIRLRGDSGTGRGRGGGGFS
jgi:hypothetical protein